MFLRYKRCNLERWEKKKSLLLTGECWRGLLFSMKPDTCLRSKFKTVQLTMWYSCLFGWKVPHKNIYLHKTFDLTQMNAQKKATAALLRLEDFICHISQNYLCWCQLCGEGAAQEVWGEERWERSTVGEGTQEGVKGRKKSKKKVQSFSTSLPYKVLPHLLLLIITIFAHWEPQERGKAPFAPASYVLGGLDVWESISAGLNLFSPQCGGWKDVYYSSWKSVVMREGCGVR